MATSKKSAKKASTKTAKKTSKKKKKPAKKPTKKPTHTTQPAAAATKVRVRMYRQGLGDCFLVSFYTAAQPVHMLVDCGTLGATTTGVTMPQVVQDIATETGKHLHLLIATHEHKDHVSGFGTEKKTFDAFTVDRVWAAWTEDATDELAKSVAKYKGDLVEAVALAANALAAAGHDAATLRSGIRGLLDFVGDVPADGAPLAAGLAQSVHDAMAYVTKRAGDNVSFLSPGAVLEPAWLPGVRFYVLGPPRSEDALKNMGEHGSPDLYELSAPLSRDLATCARFRLAGLSMRRYRDTVIPAEREELDRGLPFDPHFRVESPGDDPQRGPFAPYFRPGEAWRRIDHDWLASGSDLALQLDSYTNNTSLALAIELIADGRVLLFPADAQLGNWLSWHDRPFTVTGAHGPQSVTAAELLARTVFYKAGHHASHNGTPTTKGLEMMQRPELVAVIPLDRAVALKKVPPWLMPAEALYARLLEKAGGRVLRSDLGWPDDAERPASISAAAWAKARTDPRITVTPLYVEFRLA